VPSPKRLKIKVQSKRQITLPAEAASKFDLSKGDVLEARILEDRIELIPMVTVPRQQAWFWTPEWQAKEKEAEAARAAGDYADFDNVDDLIAGLHK